MRQLMLVTCLFIAAAARTTVAQTAEPKPPDFGSIAQGLLTSLASHDYRAILPTTYDEAAAIQNIKRNNPQILWDRLVNQFLTSRESALRQEDPDNALGAMLAFGQDDNTKMVLRTLSPLASTSATWTVLETRVDPTPRDTMSGRFLRTVTYLKAEYPETAAAVVADKSGRTVRLKEAIVEIGFRQGLIFDARRVPEGDVVLAPKSSVNGAPDADAPPRASKSLASCLEDGSGAFTRFAVSNDTFRPVEIILDDCSERIVIQAGRTYIGELRVNSRHAVRAIVGGRSFEVNLTVPRVMGALHVDNGGFVGIR